MKKIVIISYFLLTAFFAFTQNKVLISGRLIDKDSKEPLPYGNIHFPGKSLGTTSNVDGYFTFSLSGVNKTDSIIISFIGYKSLRTTISDCSKKNIFELKPQSTKIAEIEIRGEKFKLKSFMKKVIAEYNKNRKNDPHIAIAHYREKARFDGKYVMYMESLGFSTYLGKQFNVAPLSSYKFFYKDSKCSVNNPVWTNANSKYKPPLPAGSMNLNVFRYFEIDGILSSRQLKKYSLKIDTTYFNNNNSVVRVRFNGDGDKGTMAVFLESKKIVNIKCSTKKYWSTIKHSRIRADVEIQFNYFNNTPYVSKVDGYYKTKEGFEHFNTLTILVQKFNQFELTKDEYWSINNYSYNPYIIYRSKTWENYTIPVDRDFATIENDLATEELSLSEQFIQFSGRWFYPHQFKSDLAKEVISGLKSNF